MEQWIGKDVIVQWIDSGAGAREKPGTLKDLRIWIKETHGKLVGIHIDKVIQEEHPDFDPRWIELACCGAGPEDDCTELGAVWVPSIISFKVVQGAERLGEIPEWEAE